jgi:hypothetical protein
MQEQEWKEIPKYPNYEISNLGIIRNKNGRIKSNNNLINGYRSVSLSKNGNTKKFTVHQLVAITFLNHIPNGHEKVVDHINNNKLNNQLSNIQLISHKENITKDRDKSNGRYSSKYLNISFCNKRKKFRVIVQRNGKSFSLGGYECEEKAKEVLDSYNKFNTK